MRRQRGHRASLALAAADEATLFASIALVFAVSDAVVAFVAMSNALVASAFAWDDTDRVDCAASRQSERHPTQR